MNLSRIFYAGNLYMRTSGEMYFLFQTLDCLANMRLGRLSYWGNFIRYYETDFVHLIYTTIMITMITEILNQLFLSTELKLVLQKTSGYWVIYCLNQIKMPKFLRNAGNGWVGKQISGKEGWLQTTR